MKKGQVTLFIIAGVVIAVVLIAGYFFYREIAQTRVRAALGETAQLSEEERAVFEAASGCLQQVLEEGTYAAAVSGGFYPPLDQNVKLWNLQIPLYLDRPDEHVPSLEDVEKSIANYVLLHVSSCLKFDPSLNVEVGKVKDVGVFLDEGSVQGDLRVNLAGENVRAGRVITEIGSDLLKAYHEMLNFYALQKDIIGEESFGEVNLFVKDNKYKFVEAKKDDARIYLLFMNNSYIPEKPYTFSFAIKDNSVSIMVHGENRTELYFFVEQLFTSEEDGFEGINPEAEQVL